MFNKKHLTFSLNLFFHKKIKSKMLVYLFRFYKKKKLIIKWIMKCIDQFVLKLVVVLVW
jgi:hypothetical protein